MAMQFSRYDLKITREGDTERVFDIIRKKYVVLTPEEWVRQHIVHYLISDHGFPKSLISVEKKITVNTLTRRTDIVLYNQTGSPLLIVECKAPEVTLSQKTIEQAARYNLTLKVPYLWITNGALHVICKIDLESGTWQLLDTLPPVQVLLGRL